MGRSIATKAREALLARAVRERLFGIGMVPAAEDELRAVRDLAARLIGPNIASEQTLRTILRRQGCGFYVAREGQTLTALMALVLLNAAGLAAVCEGSFDPIHPDPALAISPGEPLHGVYGWGIAAATHESARVLVAGSWAVLDVLPAPFFVRATTEAGRRLLTEKMRFAPYPGSTSGLLWWDVAERRRAA